MVTLEEVKGLKYQELKDELKKLGLESTGLKAVLAARLTDALKSNSEAPSEKAKAAPAAVAPEKPTAAPTATQEIPKKTTTNGKPLISFTPNESSAAKPESKQAALPQTKPTAETSGVPATETSEADKRRQRADRFNIPASLEDKKAARAQRFGVVETGKSTAKTGDSNSIAPLSAAEKAAEEDKRKERAKRFNLPTTLSKDEIERQKKARLERFGGTADKTSSGELQAKLAARAQRFALGSNDTAAAKPAVPKPEEVKRPLDPEAEAKRKAREIKFTPK